MNADKWIQCGEDPYEEAVSAGVLPGDYLTITGARLVPGIGPMAQDCVVEILRYNHSAVVVVHHGDRRIIEWNRVIAWSKKQANSSEEKA